MIRICLFGGLSVSRDDNRTPDASAVQPRRLAILAMVAHAGDRGISRDRLHSLFWPDATEEAARRGLTQALYALRTGLAEEQLFHGVQELRLNRDVATCDVMEYADAVDGGELERAVALYRGPFLDGFRVPGMAEFDRRADEQRDELARRQESLIERLATRATQNGEPDRAVEWWRKRAAMDPLSARVAEAYIRALDAAGDRAGAIRHARIHEQLVAQEFGTEASAGVRALAEALKNAPFVAKPGPKATTPVAEAPVAALPVGDTPVVAAPVAAVLIDVAPTKSTPVGNPASERTRRPTRRIGWAVAAAVLTTSAALAWTVRRERTLRLDEVDLSTLRVSAPRRIAADAEFELDPAISPDGRNVAYVVGDEGAMRLFVRQRDDGQAVPVAESVVGDQRRPRWSPDGSSLIFQAERGVWIVPALGGSARLVVPPLEDGSTAVSPIWSPDGQDIAWAVRDTIYRMPASGGTPRAIARVLEAHSLSWSEDGAWLAATSGNSEFALGSRADHFRAGVAIGNLAPSAIVLVATAKPSSSADSTGLATVRELVAATTLNVSPTWIDRRTLVFVSNRGGTRDLFAAHITDQGTLRGNIERITAGLDAHSVSASADGLQLAYAVFRQTANVWSLPIRPESVTPLSAATRVTHGTQVVEGVDVSRDGRWLAYDADVSGQQDIFRLPLENGAPAAREAERIVSSPNDDFHPTWSPDARWIAFYTFNGRIRRAAYLPASGGPFRFVHPDGPNREEHSPVWSADGQSLWYFREERAKSALYRTVRVNDTTWATPQQMTYNGGLAASFSDDGQKMAYFSGPGTIRITDSTLSEASSRLVLSPMRSQRGGPVAMSGRITPDGKALVVKGYDSVSGGFWWYPLVGGATGNPSLLVRFDDQRRSSPRSEFGADAHFLYFALAEREADVWALQLVRR